MQFTERYLPEGYSGEALAHAERGQIRLLYAKRFSHRPSADFLVRVYKDIDAKYSAAGLGTVYTSVSSPEGEVVGVGCLRFGNEEGELMCLGVSPDHRGRGIGKWIVLDRIRRAHSLGVKTLYIVKLAETNTISNFYEEVGFEPCEQQQATIFDLSPFDGREPHIQLKLI